ncbi:MAG: GNAT family N-acetyltransferase [Actinomycetota bacterium]|nr:GNAT family N-acetyltransferase [Actinomycetota bacterium]
MTVSPPTSDSDISWAPATIEDAAGLAAAFNEVAVADGTPERLSSETMDYELTSSYQPLDRRTMLARTSTGEIAAYGTVYYRADKGVEHRVHVATYVVPTYREQGLEDALTDWVVAAAVDELRTSTAQRRYVCTGLYKKLEDVAHRFAARGFEPARHWWEMERQLEDDIVFPSQDEFTVVPWAGEYTGLIRLVHNAAFADHWGNTPISAESWQKQMMDSPGFRPDLSFVAMANGEPVGYAYNEMYPEDWEAAGRSECWIGALGVVRDWRKRGIATALLAHSMRAMHEDGLDVAMIGVDSSSPTGAHHLYESVGFRTRNTATTWQREIVSLDSSNG